MSVKELLDSIVAMVRDDLTHSPPDDTVYGTYVSGDAATGLHTITVNGQTLTGVKKYASVTGLVAGSGVECLHINKRKPLTIIGNLGTTNTASYAQAPLFAYKTADESVTSSTTLQDDNHLFLAIEANAIYEVYCQCVMTGAEGSDFKVAFTFPTGSTLGLGFNGLATTATNATGDLTNRGSYMTSGTALDVNFQTGSLGTMVQMTGILAVDTSSGSLQLQWAQAVSSGTALIVYKTASYLKLSRLS